MASTQSTAASTLRVEFGAWVESNTPKKHGTGMRKVWVSPAPTGEDERVSVIRTRDGRDMHVLTLHVSDAAEILTLALDAVTAPKAPTQAPKSARKAPTPPPAQAPAQAPAPKAPVTDAARDPKQDAVAIAANRKIAIANARANKPAPTPRVSSPAPVESAEKDMLDWLDMIRAS